MLVYTNRAGITAAAGTRLALYWLLIAGFGLKHPLQNFDCLKNNQRCCLSLLPLQDVVMGQFACLLPTLAVVAVSQAPSTESNPDSPRPVKAIVNQ